MLGGIQLGLLVEVPLCEIGGRVLGDIQLGLLVEVPLCEIDGRVLAYSLGCWWMLFCELDGARGHPAWAAGGGAAIGGRVLGACSLGCWWMLFCSFAGLTAGC